MRAAPQLEPQPASRVRQGRKVGVHYSDYAAVRGAQPYEWSWMFGPSPAEALREVLERVRFAPAEVQARAMAMGDVAILARMPADAPAHLDPGKVRPLAFIAEGLTAEETAETLRELMRQGWRP